MATTLSAVAFEVRDVRGTAAFWARALGWEHAENGTVRPPEPGGVDLLFTASARPKTGKNRLHLDLTGGADQAAEVARLLALGATRADIGQGDVPWEVLADPEGNEFCVLPGAPAFHGLAQLCQDAADPEVQGRFWAAATGWTVTERGAWGVRLRPAPAAEPSIVMGPPVTARSGPSRVRFTVAPLPGADPAAEAARLIAAGATGKAADGLADPESNDFRLAPPLP